MNKRAGKKASEVVVTAQDFPHRPKNNFWFVGVVTLSVAGGYVAIMAKDYLMLAVVIAAAIALLRVAGFAPSTRTIRLNDRGITWGEKFYGYHQLKAFWVVPHDDSVSVHLERPNANLSISFVIGVGEVDEVLTVLDRHLPHHQHRSEPIGERFARLIRL